MTPEERDQLLITLMQQIKVQQEQQQNQGVVVSPQVGNTNNLPKLDGKNYQSWREIVEITLQLRGLIKAIREDVDEVTNLQAKLVLFETMDESHRSQVRGCATAKEIMTRLALIYADKSASNLHRILTDYYRYTKDPGHTISEHIGKMDEMRNTLRELKISVEDDRIHQATIIGSLPPEYGSMMECWDMTHPDMRTTENLVSRLLKREIDLKKSRAIEYGLVAGASGRQSYKERMKKVQCYNCEEFGHIAKNCGQPRKNRSNDKDSGYQNSASKAAKANVVQEEDANESSANKNTKPHWAAVARIPRQAQGYTGVPQSLAADNLKKMAARTKTSWAAVASRHINMSVGKGVDPANYWISGSGATNHMCKVKEWFFELTMFKQPIKCTVGDGNQMDLLGVGSINVVSRVDGIDSESILKKVFFAPSLSVNLFSI